MGMTVYSQEQYYIQEVRSNTKKGYIIANKNKEFHDGHSHLNNFKAAKYVLNLAVKEKMPHDLDTYRMISLYRILEDGPFREKVLKLIETRAQKKKDMYFNVAAKESRIPKIP